MYESLRRFSKLFHLYIVAFDDLCYSILKSIDLKSTTIISLNEFEDEVLLNVKPNRTKGEYCWTCTPSVIKYVIENYNLELCTYLDADLYFYDDPEVLIKEIEDGSVLITEHRYTPKYDYLKHLFGIYCVQFITFKNDSKGMSVLNWWRNACIDWCYAKHEGNRFGDQKYLDDWLTRFEGVKVLQHLGGGIAPWNVQQYEVFIKEDKIYGIEKATGKKFEVIFYHFHNLKFLLNNKIDLSNYKLSDKVISIFYKPYIKKIFEIENKLKIDLNIDISSYGRTKPEKDIISFLRLFKRRLIGTYNHLSIEDFCCLND